jgi:single-strand DNA-binding protein
MSLNNVSLTGNMTKDPELKFTPTGTAVVSFSIGVTRDVKNDTGGYDTDFINITAWQKTAEFVGKYLKKGRLVGIEGRIQTRQWIDQATGLKRNATDIVANKVSPLGPKPPADDTEEGATEVEETPAVRPQPAATKTTAPVEDDDDDTTDPFANE